MAGMAEFELPTNESDYVAEFERAGADAWDAAYRLEELATHPEVAWFFEQHRDGLADANLTAIVSTSDVFMRVARALAAK
jgi:hypothetical protein